MSLLRERARTSYVVGGAIGGDGDGRKVLRDSTRRRVSKHTPVPTIDSCVASRSDGPTPRGQRGGALLRPVPGRDWTPKMIGWMRARASGSETIHLRGAETALPRRRRDELGLDWTSAE